MTRKNPNAWRWELDPRDPDYDDPPETPDGLGDITGSLLDPMDEPWDYDGPRNYVPYGDR